MENLHLNQHLHSGDRQRQQLELELELEQVYQAQAQAQAQQQLQHLLGGDHNDMMAADYDKESKAHNSHNLPENCDSAALAGGEAAVLGAIAARNRTLLPAPAPAAVALAAAAAAAAAASGPYGLSYSGGKSAAQASLYQRAAAAAQANQSAASAVHPLNNSAGVFNMRSGGYSLNGMTINGFQHPIGVGVAAQHQLAGGGGGAGAGSGLGLLPKPTFSAPAQFGMHLLPTSCTAAHMNVAANGFGHAQGLLALPLPMTHPSQSQPLLQTSQQALALAQAQAQRYVSKSQAARWRRQPMPDLFHAVLALMHELNRSVSYPEIINTLALRLQRPEVELKRHVPHTLHTAVNNGYLRKDGNRYTLLSEVEQVEIMKRNQEAALRAKELEKEPLSWRKR